MNVKFTLWDAVEQNEQIELLLTRLEDAFKELKQKGYKTNINVQEKLKEIDKQIDILLEEQAKLNNKEKPMMDIKCGYKAQTVNITKDSVGYHCPIVDSVNGDFTFNDPSLENLVKKYKNFVDSKDRIEDDCPYNMSLGVTYKDETLHINSYNPHTSALVKRYIADANFTPKIGTLSLDKFVDQFVDYVDNKDKVTQVEDPDLAIVEQFFSELKRVNQEMTALGQVDNIVLAVKLNHVYEFYKGWIPLTHEVVGSYYYNMFVKK